MSLVSGDDRGLLARDRPITTNVKLIEFKSDQSDPDIVKHEGVIGSAANTTTHPCRLCLNSKFKRNYTVSDLFVFHENCHNTGSRGDTHVPRGALQAAVRTI